MKKYLILLLSAILCLSSCKKPSGGSEQNVPIVGQWKLETFAGVEAESNDLEVYLDFSSSKTFKLYQRLGGGHFTLYEGSYSIAGSVLSGSYASGKSWGSSYDVSISESGTTLTLTSRDASKVEVCTYTQTTIPSSVLKDAQDYASTKAPTTEPKAWL